MVEVSNEQQRCSIRKRPGTEDGKKKSNRNNTCSNEKWTNLKMRLTIRSSRSGHLAVFPGKIVRKMGPERQFCMVGPPWVTKLRGLVGQFWVTVQKPPPISSHSTSSGSIVGQGLYWVTTYMSLRTLPLSRPLPSLAAPVRELDGEASCIPQVREGMGSYEPY